MFCLILIRMNLVKYLVEGGLKIVVSVTRERKIVSIYTEIDVDEVTINQRINLRLERIRIFYKWIDIVTL